jgi:tripartite-type tricarboxylate transporter receptor subunit TctC
VLVAHPSFAAKTVPDLLAMAKAKPAVDFSSGGNASPQHYAKTGEIIRAAGMKLEQ